MASVLEEVQGAVQYLVQAKQCLSNDKFVESRKAQVDRLAVLCSSLPSNQHSGTAMRTLRESGVFTDEQLERLAEGLGSAGRSSVAVLWQQGKCQDYEHFFRVLPAAVWEQIAAGREAEEWEVFSVLAEFLARAGCISPSEYTCRSLTAFMLLRFRKDCLSLSAEEKHDCYVKYKDALRARLQGHFDSNPERKCWPIVWKLTTPNYLPTEWLQCSGIGLASAATGARPKESEVRCYALTIACRDTHRNLCRAGRKTAAEASGSNGGEVKAVMSLLEKLLVCLPQPTLEGLPLTKQLTQTAALPVFEQPAPEGVPALTLTQQPEEQPAALPASLPESLPEPKSASQTASPNNLQVSPSSSTGQLPSTAEVN